ncbi:MAG: hypothetical protein ABWZ52_09095 [Acidimicrobiales bacterium]
MKRAPLLIATGVGAVSGVYTIIYLYRWEWNRAIICALFFVATEVVIVAIVLMRRMRRLEDQLVALADDVRVPPTDAVLGQIREHAPEPHDHFAWLRDTTGRTNVFLPVLLGAGVLASAAAWMVEHVARVTTIPALERRLAERVAVISLPTAGLLEAVPAEPTEVRRRWRWLASGALLLVGATLAAVSLDFIADRIQSRSDERSPGVQTVIGLELRGATALSHPERAVDELWTTCTSTNVFRRRMIPEPQITHFPGGAAHVVVPEDLGEHGTARLVGCLNDATLDKVQASVVMVATR